MLTTGTLGNSLLYSYLYHLNFKIKSKFESGKKFYFWTKNSTSSQKVFMWLKIYKDPYICLLAHEQKMALWWPPRSHTSSVWSQPWILEGCCLEFIKGTQARGKVHWAGSVSAALQVPAAPLWEPRAVNLQWICFDLILWVGR